MKKVISLLVAAAMLCVLFSGCGNPGQPGADNNGKPEVTESTEASPSTAASESTPVGEVSTGISGTGSPAADSYTAFLNAKNIPLTKLTDGLSNNEDTMWASMSLLGVAMVDMYMLPVAFFGAGEEAATAGLAMLGAQGVQYTENGNSYTIAYTNSEGSTASLTGTFDAATGSLNCSGSKDGVENFYSEYLKTSYGYISQYYFVNDDGTALLYVSTVQGEDGAFGISSAQKGKPVPLTGSEPADYPTTLPEWYAIKGSQITGAMSDGTAVSFEYVPSETASN